MYLFDKVIKVSGCRKYAVMKVWDVPDRMGRGYADSSPESAMNEMKHNGAFSVGPRPQHSCGGDYSAVLVSDLKATHPYWLMTEEQLLSEFEAMQQDKGPPIENPVLLEEAKRLWAEKMADRNLH